MQPSPQPSFATGVKGSSAAASQAVSADVKQGWWHLDDNALILPEYLVQLGGQQASGLPPAKLTCTAHLLLHSLCQNRTQQLRLCIYHHLSLFVVVFAGLAQQLPQCQQPGLAGELPQVAGPLSHFLAFADQPTSLAMALHLPQQQVLDPVRPQIVAADPLLEASAAAAIALPPLLPPRPRLYQLSERAVLAATGCSMLALLTHLNLHGSALKKIEASFCDSLSDAGTQAEAAAL